MKNNRYAAIKTLILKRARTNDGQLTNDYKKLLKIIYADKFKKSHKNEGINRRAKIKAQLIAMGSPDSVAIFSSGMDCDCNQYVNYGGYQVAATPMAIDKEIQSCYECADGPINVWFTTIKEGKKLKKESYDLIAAAHEDGHPSTVYLR